MRITFLIVIGIHGLIHLLGFAKAIGLSDVKQLTQPISKTFGVLWLLTFALIMIAAILFAFKNGYWWAIAFIAVLTSQVLIICFWQDAKFGTIANVSILMASIIGYETWSYYDVYLNDVKIGLLQKEYFTNTILTEIDIQRLPEGLRNIFVIQVVSANQK